MSRICHVCGQPVLEESSRTDMELVERLSFEEVERLAYACQALHFPGVDHRLLICIASVESAFDPLAIGDGGASIGMMQTKLSTARWLYDDMGYRHFTPSDDSLKRPHVSLYFAGAFLDWLSTYRGDCRSKRWMARAYNAGAEGAIRGYAQGYLDKIQAAHRRFFHVELEG